MNPDIFQNLKQLFFHIAEHPCTGLRKARCLRKIRCLRKARCLIQTPNTQSTSGEKQ